MNFVIIICTGRNDGSFATKKQKLREFETQIMNWSIVVSEWFHKASNNFFKLPWFGQTIAVVSIPVTFILIRCGYIILYRRISKIPGGLIGVPYFGSLFTVVSYGKEFNDKLLPQYGPICVHNIGGRSNDIITINDIKLVEAIFKSKYCRNRPVSSQIAAYKGHLAVSFSNDNDKQFWHEKRKLFQKTITTFAKREYFEPNLKKILSKTTFSNLNSLINDNNNNNDNKKKKNSNCITWYPKNDVRYIMFNLIFSLLIGDPFNINEKTSNDKIFLDFMAKMDLLVEIFPLKIISGIFPMFGLTSLLMGNIDNKFDHAFQLFTNQTKKYCDNYNISNNNSDNNNNTNDNNYNTLIEILYKEMSKSDNRIWNKDLMHTEFVNLFVAGIDTTSYNLEMCILYLAKYSNIQNEIRRELINTFGIKNDDYNNNTNINNMDNILKHVDLSKVNNCVTFRAFIHEVLRIGCAVPRSISHAVTQKCGLSFDS